MIAVDAIDFDKDGTGLVPAVVQDAASGEILMLAWMNRTSFAETLRTGLATFWSRSRNELWQKGATSGHFLKVKGIATDCDADALVIQATPVGPACHTGARSCFYEPVEGAPSLDRSSLAPLAELERTLEERRVNPPEGSYVAKLFANETKRHKKVGEEATELVIASLQNKPDEVASEAADLVFHALVLLKAHGLGLGDVAKVLEGRVGAPRRE